MPLQHHLPISQIVEFKVHQGNDFPTEATSCCDLGIEADPFVALSPFFLFLDPSLGDTNSDVTDDAGSSVGGRVHGAFEEPLRKQQHEPRCTIGLYSP